MKILLKWFASAAVIFALAQAMPGIEVETWKTALLVALVLGFLNVFLKPLLHLLALPLTIVTLGLFALVINTGIVLAAAKIVPGFYIQGFWQALFFSVALALVNSFFQRIGDEN